VKLLRKTPEYIAQFASLKTILSQALHVVAFFVAPYFTISSPLILCVGNMIGWVARIAAGSRSLGSASIYSVAVAIRLSFMALRRTGKYNDITQPFSPRVFFLNTTIMASAEQYKPGYLQPEQHFEYDLTPLFS
jgi:hypothetical protein